MNGLSLGRHALSLGAMFSALLGFSIAHADGPSLTASPTSVTFSDQDVGTTSSAPTTVTISSGGEEATTLTAISVSGQFKTTGGKCAVGGSVGGRAGSCTVLVVFAPTTEGPKTGSLTITTRNRSVVVSLNGKANAPKPVAILTGSGEFGSVGLLDTAPQTFTLTNKGPGVLNGISVGVSGGVFSLASGAACPSSLDAGGSCQFSVTFTPTDVSRRTGELTVSTSTGTPVSRMTVPLSGQGEAPKISVSPATLTFLDTVVGTTSASLDVTVTNVGKGKLVVSSVAVPPGFQAVNKCGTSQLPTGTPCTISVQFSPTSVANYNGTMTINSNASAPATVALSGKGIDRQGRLSVSPASLVFSKNCRREESSVAAQSIRVSNTGNAPLTGLTVAPLAITGFQISNGCSSQLAAGASCQVTVRFSGRTTSAGVINVTSTSQPVSPVSIAGNCTSQASP